MTETDKLYYKKMLKKERLLPFIRNGKLICFISFYITNDPEKYIERDNPWSIEEDNNEGTIAVIDQLWSDRNAFDFSFQIWKGLVNHIKENFENVKYLRWNRWKNNKVYKFNVSIKKEKKK